MKAVGASLTLPARLVQSSAGAAGSLSAGGALSLGRAFR